jgi:hypothetical protein
LAHRADLGTSRWSTTSRRAPCPSRGCTRPRFSPFPFTRVTVRMIGVKNLPVALFNGYTVKLVLKRAQNRLTNRFSKYMFKCSTESSVTNKFTADILRGFRKGRFL